MMLACRTNFLGISSQIDITSSTATLPDWWKHGTTQCRSTSGMSVSFDFTSGPLLSAFVRLDHPPKLPTGSSPANFARSRGPLGRRPSFPFCISRSSVTTSPNPRQGRAAQDTLSTTETRSNINLRAYHLSSQYRFSTSRSRRRCAQGSSGPPPDAARKPIPCGTQVRFRSQRRVSASSPSINEPATDFRGVIRSHPESSGVIRSHLQ